MSDKWFDKACKLDALLQLQTVRAEAAEQENERLRVLLKEAARFYPPHDHEPRVNLIGAEIDKCLTAAEQQAQGKRCSCHGADDYCICQNARAALEAKP